MTIKVCQELINVNLDEVAKVIGEKVINLLQWSRVVSAK